MNALDQNSVRQSWMDALSAGPNLIDGRTEQDRLSFLADFASLINFYDKDNRIYGNWSPFLKKDPVFLLADIAQTPYGRIHKLYQQTLSRLQQLLANTLTPEVLILLGQLMEQMIRVFMRIERWTYFMQLSDDSYALKEDLLDQISERYSLYFWAIVGLKQDLSTAFQGKGIDPVSYYLFDRYDALTWKQNQNKAPFWEVLGLDSGPLKNPSTDLGNIVEALSKAGTQLFSFFYEVIQRAGPMYVQLAAQRSKYPDTTLLRTFVHLLQFHQTELNGLATQHMNFYFQQVLKQGLRPAIADQVYLYATLAKKDAVTFLPAQTLLVAGLDAEKNPVYFSTTEEVQLNPASVTGAQTLGLGGDGKWHWSTVANPGVVMKDPDGNMLSWATFGGGSALASGGNASASGASTSTVASLGLAIASPLLLLREGVRTITCVFSYTGTLDISILQGAVFALSTASTWWTVQPAITLGAASMPGPASSSGASSGSSGSTGSSGVSGSSVASGAATTTTQTFQLVFSLGAGDPPIEAFSQNPDGFSTVWPQLKIVFGQFTKGETPPVLQTLKLNVSTTGVKTLSLYNDNGGLSTKTSFPFLGPAPLMNSHFFVGSTEAFSKPLNSLVFHLTWDSLPDDFAQYYVAYNAYLNNEYNMDDSTSWTSKVWDWIKGLFTKKSSSSAPEKDVPFNNDCFTAGFDWLQPSGWVPFTMQNENGSSCLFTELPPAAPVASSSSASSAPASGTGAGPSKTAPEATSPVKSQAAPVTPSPMPSTSSAPTLAGASDFSWNGKSDASLVWNPIIQNTPLKYEDNSQTGFVRLSLSGPKGLGFGSAVYPNVVYAVALINGKESASMIPPPALPFVPKLKSFTLDYTASVSYSLTSPSTVYPLQVFSYNPLGNETLLDANTAKEVSLFSALPGQGILFLNLENVIPGGYLSLYIELCRLSTTVSISNQIGYFYYAEDQWKALTLLQDNTANLSCSGILGFSVPTDISVPNRFMITLAEDPSTVAQTILIQTNGFTAQRTGSNYLTDTVAPTLAPGTITKTFAPFPKIMGIAQPFASFGGKPAETTEAMNKRVSLRIKTKDRIVSADDFGRMIQDAYPGIFYVKPYYNPSRKGTDVYLLPACRSQSDPHAFAPMVSACLEKKVTDFLLARTSVFAGIVVSGFQWQYVYLSTNIIVQPGYALEGISKNVQSAFNLFLSPWIPSGQPQALIDQPITDAQVAEVLEKIEGVQSVSAVSFTTMLDASPGAAMSAVQPLAPGALMVPGLNYSIQCVYAT